MRFPQDSVAGLYEQHIEFLLPHAFNIKMLGSQKVLWMTGKQRGRCSLLVFNIKIQKPSRMRRDRKEPVGNGLAHSVTLGFNKHNQKVSPCPEPVEGQPTEGLFISIGCA